MESIYGVHLMVVVLVLCLGMLMGTLCQNDTTTTDEFTAVYIVTLKQIPTSHYFGEVRKDRFNTDFIQGASGKSNTLYKHKPRYY